MISSATCILLTLLACELPLGIITQKTPFAHADRQASLPEVRQGQQRLCQHCPCGVSNQWTRIIGGTETLINEYPWVAALMVRNKVICGATLINDLYLVSAAHCFASELVNREMRVILSEHNFLVNDESVTEVHFVDRFIVHPEYLRVPGKRGRDGHDIALVKLRLPVRVRQAVSPACLPPPDFEYDLQPAVISGWGYTTEGGPTSNVLLAAMVPILSRERCLMFSNYTSEEITDNLLCAGFVHGGFDACQGDSGSGMTTQDWAKRWAVAGIVSWGEGCGRPGAPGVYTRVSRYLDWIVANTRDACYCL